MAQGRLIRPGPKVIILFSLATELSMLINVTMPSNGNFSCFGCGLLTFFSKLTFSKKNSGTLSSYQTVLIQIRTDILLVLLRAKTVCKGYQQTTKAAPSKDRVKEQI